MTDKSENQHEASHSGQDFPSLFFLFFQAIFLIFYAVGTTYDAEFDEKDGQKAVLIHKMGTVYTMYQDVHVMIFVGFGFLMTFLRKYSYSSVGLNFAMSALAVQSAILVNGFWYNVFMSKWDKIVIDIPALINADFVAGTVMISFGAILGKASPIQCLFMVVLEVILASLNYEILVKKLKIADVGGSFAIHTFGAFFGLAVSYALTNVRQLESKPTSKNNAPVYHSDMFAMIGTLFLFMFWPSFNAAPVSGDFPGARQRAVVNTLLAISASCFTAFMASRYLRGHKKFDMVDIQNATIAGGVAVGAMADFNINPAGAVAVGMASGFISVCGYAFLMSRVVQMGVHDTCGVLNLHGMPGVLGCIASAIAAGYAQESRYGSYLTTLFPARADGRSAIGQGGFQMAALCVTLGISVVGGLITGALMKSSVFAQVEQVFVDSENWAVPSEEVPYYFANVHDERVSRPSDKFQGAGVEMAKV